MRIVDRKTFLGLPPGIVFNFYEPQIFDGLHIKGISYDNDFRYIDLIGNVKAESLDEQHHILFEVAEQGSPFDLDFDDTDRDGMFNDNQLFAIYSRDDLVGLIGALRKAKGYDQWVEEQRNDE